MFVSSHPCYHWIKGIYIYIYTHTCFLPIQYQLINFYKIIKNYSKVNIILLNMSKKVISSILNI